ncbi:MAG: HAMP domain-containing histidine kinase, partial [Gammaproteobacteria bacterium]|nr:HAMP domain-containing histidine kinase [Gammaproteobacteria bacterium]
EDYLNDIFTSGKHLLNLINDVLDLSKIEAGKLEVELEKIDLRQLLEGSLVVVRERALTHDIRLSLDMADDVDTVTADERKVKQIVFNLLSNAVKFTPDKGQVGIRARKSDALVEIAVWDSGVGIALEDQQRIFEEFQQAERGLTDKQEGTGLGLALTKKFVELHGGNIWAESTRGHGSTFTFTLPVDGTQEPKNAPES